VSRDLLRKKAQGVFGEMGRMIGEMRRRNGKPGQPVILQVSHRIGPLPGLREMLAAMDGARVMELEPGSAALGALRLWHESSGQEGKGGVTLMKSRPWPWRETPPPQPPSSVETVSYRSAVPTHALYRGLAYPLSSRPVVVGSGGFQEGVDIRIYGQLAGVSRRHCSLHLRGDEVLLTDHSTYGTFVDGEKVSGTALLKLGQFIRLGTPGETLQIIGCVERDGT